MNASKLRTPLGTVELVVLPDSRERLCCGFLVKVSKMFGSCSQTILILAPSLIDKDFLVAAPIDLRTKKAESSSTSVAGLLVPTQEKESQDRFDVTDRYYEKL